MKNINSFVSPNNKGFTHNRWSPRLFSALPPGGCRILERRRWEIGSPPTILRNVEVNGRRPLQSGTVFKIVMTCVFAISFVLTGRCRAAASYVTISSPANGATVHGTVTIATRESSYVRWINVFVDSRWIAASSPGALPPYSVNWNSTTVSDGSHTVSVTGYNVYNAAIASAQISLKVQNLTPTPTPTPISSCISITAPGAGATVSGSSVAISTKDTCSGLWFENLYVDGSFSNSFAPGAVVFNSTTFSNGTHTIKVTSQSENPGSVTLGSASELLNIENGSATATPSPKATATPSPKPTTSPAPTATKTPIAHLGNLAPKATLPSDSTCAVLANQANFPETTAENVNDGTGWNANDQIWTTPSYFYTNAGRNGLAPASDFAAVDGMYAGTTPDIIRWAACKWGVDEDWAYAETAVETGSWTNACAQMHGGSTCHETGDCGNYDSNSGGESANLSFLGFPVTNSAAQFIGPNAYTGQNANGSTCSSIWSSWGIIQSKARFFEWYTWPMLAVSTAWGEDYRWAKYRACVNGDYATWFGNSSDYLNAVSRAQSNPNGLVPSGQAGPTNLFTNETNMQYLGLGCVATHFSGSWYDSGAVTYLTNSSSGFLYHLNNSVWPGGRR